MRVESREWGRKKQELPTGTCRGKKGGRASSCGVLLRNRKKKKKLRVVEAKRYWGVHKQAGSKGYPLTDEKVRWW